MTEGDTFSTEQTYYIWRIPLILIVTVIAAIILASAIPEINEALVRADTLAASIAFDTELFTAPGVITQQSWQSYEYESINYQASELNRLPAARITLRGEGLQEQSKYTNQQLFNSMDVQGGVGGILDYTTILPITYKTETSENSAELLIEIRVRQ